MGQLIGFPLTYSYPRRYTGEHHESAFLGKWIFDKDPSENLRKTELRLWSEIEDWKAGTSETFPHNMYLVLRLECHCCG